MIDVTELERDTPRYLVGFLVAAIFAAEGAIMGILSLFGLVAGVVAGFIDSVLLSLVLFPLLYFGVFKEIKQKTAKILTMDEELRAANARLEARVQKRTLQLEESKSRLEAALGELGNKQKRLAAVRNLHRLLHSAINEREAYLIAGSELPKVLPKTSGALYITKPSRNVLVRTVQWPDDASWDQSLTPETCWALRLGHVFTGSDPAASAACTHGSRCSRSSTRQICVPLVARGETLGVLSVEVTHLLSETEIQEYEEFVSLVAGGLALALANVQLRAELEAQAYHDQLTGLFNRRFFLEELQLEIHNSDRSRKPLSVIMLDIDHFKQFNDLYGHDAGDAVLSAFGHLLKDTFRLGDIACRYGGEEFVIVLPDSSPETALRRAGDIIDRVRKMPVQHSGHDLGRVTVSAGVATYLVHAHDAEGLLKVADAALYASKKAGRDTVTLAEPTLSLVQMPRVSRSEKADSDQRRPQAT